MKANRFRYKVWVRENMDLDGCKILDDDMRPDIKKGWLKGQVEWFQISPNGQELQWGNEDPFEPLIVGKDVDLVFSTGLCDRDGKEIFEGDILGYAENNLAWNWDKKNYVEYEVFYHDNDSCDRHIGFQMNRVHYHGNICGTSWIPDFKPSTVKDMKVIGNIYQNPELLNKEPQ